MNQLKILFSYFIYCLKHPFLYKGRARRKEYWGYILYLVIISLIFSFLIQTIPNYSNNIFIDYLFIVFTIIYFLFLIFITLSTYAAQVRRLHDLNLSGLWILIPLALMIIFLIFIVYVTTYIVLNNINIFNIDPNNIPHELMVFSIIYLILVGINFIVNIIYMIIMAIKGTTGPNKYGEDPLQLDNN